MTMNQDLLIIEQPNDLQASLDDAVGQIMASSAMTYKSDAKAFASWLYENDLQLQQLTRSHMIAYRKFLQEKYAVATAARMLSITRRILDEAVFRNVLPANPLKEIRGFKVNNESTHMALTKQQAKEFFDSIDHSTVKGKRDYAILYLLIKTGLRRSECAALNIGDMTHSGGHHVFIIQHGKGDKRATVKLPGEVFNAIQEYLIASERIIIPEQPLFTGFTKSHKPTGKRISAMLIYRTLKEYTEPYEELKDLTPHGLRVSFGTLSKEGGANLEQRQHTLRHSDPRTTQRYDQRKNNLDDNAVDYVKF